MTHHHVDTAARRIHAPPSEQDILLRDTLTFPPAITRTPHLTPHATRTIYRSSPGQAHDTRGNNLVDEPPARHKHMRTQGSETLPGTGKRSINLIVVVMVPRNHTDHQARGGRRMLDSIEETPAVTARPHPEIPDRPHLGSSGSRRHRARPRHHTRMPVTVPHHQDAER